MEERMKDGACAELAVVYTEIQRLLSAQREN
jgi:hypothetical protein